MNRFVKITGFASAGILILLTLLLFLVSSGLFNNWISRTVCRIADQQLNAELRIEKMEGNPLSHILLKKIQLRQNEENLITLEEVEIKFNIWKIIEKKLQITDLRIDGTSVFLQQEKDGLWNLEKLIPDTGNSEPKAPSSPLSWKIELTNAYAKNFEAKIVANDSTQLIPRSVKFDASLDFKFAADMMNFNLHKFELTTQKPSLHIKDLQFQANLIDSVFHWTNFELQLPKSTIVSKGSVPFNQLLHSELSVHASPFDFEDVNGWIPSIHGKPDLKLEITKKENNSQVDFSLRQQNQALQILGEIKDINNLPSFHFLLKADSINGQYWTHRADLKSNIKGEFELTGKGLDFKENTMHARAKFADLKYKNYELDDFTLLIDKNRNELEAKAKASTIFGNLNSNIHIEKLFKLANYNAEVKISNLDFSKLLLDKNLKSDLNLELLAIGQGFSPGELQTKLYLKSRKSALFNQPVINLNANILINKKEYQINEINFDTPYLKMMLTGKGNITENNLLQLKLKTKNIKVPLVALGLKPVDFNGEITSNLSGPSNALNFVSDIAITNAQLDSLVVKNFKAKLLSHFSGAELVKALDSIGNESDSNPFFKNLSLKAKSTIEYLAFEKFYLSNIDLDLKKNDETITGNISSSGIFGNLSSNFTIQDLFSTPDYQLESSFRNIDLYRITENAKLRSDLNLKILAKGKGIQPDSMETTLKILSSESSIFNLPIENLNANINYNKGNYKIKGFHLETPFAFAELIGEGNWDNNNSLKLQVKTTDIAQLNSALGTDDLQLNAQLAAEIIGPADSLNVFSSASIDQLQVDTIHINKIIADANIHFADTSYSGSIQLKLDNSKIQDFNLKELQLKSTFDQHKANNSFSFFASDSLHGKINYEIQFDKNPSISLIDIHLNVNNKIWEKGNKPNHIQFWQDSIEINNLEIRSDESIIKADGIFAFQGKEDLHIQIQNLNLVSISGLQLMPYQISGKLTTLLDITGTASQPIIKGIFDIHNPIIDGLKLRQFHSKYNYANNQLHFETQLDDFSTQLVNAKLKLPLHFSFTEMILSPKKDNPFSAIVKVNKLDISKYNQFIPTKGIEVKGYLNALLKIDSTLNNPDLKGTLKFTKGAFQYQKLGMNYSNIELNSSLKNKKINLDSLVLFAGKGKLKMNGSAEMQSFVDGEIKNIDLILDGQNFKAFDSEILKAVINTNLSLNGNPESSIFKGKVAILNSTLNTDIFLKEFNRVYDDSNQALLVTARKNAEHKQIIFKTKIDSSTKKIPNIYKNLKGHFDIEIPRNTWVKGKNMNFELAGNLKLIKENEQIDIFGSMNVKRGFYKIYGRRLEFEEGEVTLTGGASINPVVNFKIAYQFRDPDNQLRKLNVNISGRISKPELAFFLDDSSIEEKDAISYLLFNKSTNQLDARENTSMKNSNLDLAKDLAIGQVSNVIKDALQSSLGLDVIEISGKSGWTQGSVSVGKYITNNLYLNYERTFAIDKKDKVIEPEKISMEYQFYRSLFLQATNQSSNSGFDFILKWSWK